MNGEPDFDPIALGVKPTPAQTEEFNPIALGAKPAPVEKVEAFDPIALGARPDRRAKMRDLEEQINATVDQPDVHEKLKSDYAAEDEAYRKERSFLGRVKDWYSDTDISGAAKGLYTKLQELTPERLIANAAAKEALNLAKEGKTAETITKSDLAKSGVKVAGKALASAGVGAGVGAMDAIHGTADIIANAGGELASAAGRKDVAAALDAERVGLLAEKEEAVKDLTQGLGIEQDGAFEAGRIAGGVAVPISLPGAGKALRGASKLTDEAGKVLAAGAKKAAGGVLRAGFELPGVVADAVTLGLAAKAGAPAIGLAAHIPGGGVAGSAVGARMAANMLSDDSLLGLGKYVKAASDAMAEKVATAAGKVPSDLVSHNVARVDNLTQAIGDWSTDIQRKITAKPKGAADILMKSKVGESIVDNAEKVGADLMSAQDDVISTLQKELDESGLSAGKRSLINAKLDDVSSTLHKELDEPGLSTYRRSRINAKMDDVISTLQKELDEPGLSADKRSLIKAKMDDVISTLQKKLDESGLSADKRSLINAKMDDVISTLQKELDKPVLSAYRRSLINTKLDAAQAHQASIAAGVGVVKRLKTAEQLTDVGAKALADATLGATAGTALAAATSKPSDQNALGQGIVNGAFFGTLLSSLGRAAIEHAPDNPLASPKNPIGSKEIAELLENPDYATTVRNNTELALRKPAEWLEVVDSIPEDSILVNAPSTVQKSTGLEVGDSVPKNAPAMLESGRAPLALPPGSTEVAGLLESGAVPKALRAPLAEELPLGNTKASAPDMAALRARVEKTQKVIDELSAKDVTEGLTDNELVTLEQAEATIARDVETLKGLEASELTSAKKSQKILAMEKSATETNKERYENVKKTVEDLHKEVVKEDKAVGGALNPGVKDLSKYEAAYKKWEAAKAELDKLSDEVWNESRASKKTTTEVVDDKTANARVSVALEDARKSFNIEKTTKEYEAAVKKYMYAAPEDRQALWGGVVKELNKMIKDAGPRKAKKKILSAAPESAPAVEKQPAKLTQEEIRAKNEANYAKWQEGRDAWVEGYAKKLGEQYTDQVWAKAEALKVWEKNRYEQAKKAFGEDSQLAKDALADYNKAADDAFEIANSAQDEPVVESAAPVKPAGVLAEVPVETPAKTVKPLAEKAPDVTGVEPVEEAALSPRQFTEADVRRANLASSHEITPEALNSRVEKFRSDLTKTASVLGDVPAEISAKIENLTDMFVEDIRRDLAWKAKNPGMMAAGPAANKRSSKYPEMSVTKDVLAKFEQNVNGALLRRKAELNAPKREAALAKKKESAAAADESVKAATKASVGTAGELISALKDFSKSTGRTQQKASANAALKLIKEKGVSPTASTESIQGLYDDIASGKAYSNHLPNVVKF